MRNCLIICLLCCFNSIVSRAQQDSAFVLSEMYFNSHDYDKAAVEIQRSIFFGNDSPDVFLLASRIYSALGCDSDSDMFLEKYRERSASDTSASLSDNTKKSRKLACWMSAIVPGLGQYYAVNFKQGLSSELLVGTSTALSLLMFEYYKPVVAIFSSVPLFCRFYTGGILNAEHCVVD